jgi:hypothetical protein
MLCARICRIFSGFSSIPINIHYLKGKPSLVTGS